VFFAVLLPAFVVPYLEPVADPDYDRVFTYPGVLPERLRQEYPALRVRVDLVRAGKKRPFEGALLGLVL